MKKVFTNLRIMQLFLFLIVALNCWCQNGEWTGIRPLDVPKLQPASCVFEGLIYVFGGLSNEVDGSICDFGSSSVHIYDPVTDTWGKGKSMLYPRSRGTAEVVYNKIYLIGGWSGMPDLRRYEDIIIYDPRNNNWEKDKVQLLSPRKSHGSCVVGDLLFVIGGLDEEENGISNMDALNLQSGNWIKMAPMPTARGNITVNYINNEIFVIGGNSKSKADPLPVIEVYNIQTETWKRSSINLPKGLTCHSTILFDDLIYIAGGVTGRDLNSSGLIKNHDVFAFHPGSMTFSFIADMAKSGACISFNHVNNEFFLMEGHDLYPYLDRCDYLRLALKYTPVRNPLIAVNGEINSSYLKPYGDSVSFRAEIISRNVNPVSAGINILNSTQEPIAYIDLFDDGRHADLNEADGVFGNYISELNMEDVFSIQVIGRAGVGKSKFTSTDIVRPFTTVGPIRLDGYSIKGKEIVKDTGKQQIYLDLIVSNLGSIGVAEDISLDLFCSNQNINIISKELIVGDISPGKSIKHAAIILMNTSPGKQVTGEILIMASIKSGEYSFWNDQISIKLN